MKKIFFALVAIFGLWSCVQEDLPVTGGNTTNSEGGYVEVGFSVVLPDMKEATRAMDAPAIERLHLLVFDDQGVLADAVPASPVNGWGVSTTDQTKFTAKLARTGHKRTIHLVANSPIADVNDYPMSTESSIIAAMEISGGKDAYWQRIEFPDGIYDNGNPVYVNDIPTYYPHQDIIDKLTAVPLVRNYSRVKVVNAISSGTQLYNVEFVLVNIPEKGSVAPFNTNTGKFQAINDSSTYDTLLADNYNGYEPTGRELINNTFNGGELICEDYTGWVAATAANADSGYHYLYERNQNIDPLTPAYILVKGSYDSASATPTYYKVAIINTDGVSYNLLRNIQYTVSIKGVLGEGFKTAKEAYEAGPSNNINFSVETKNLLNLSDGTRTIYVEYTQKVINTANTEVTLRYKYDDTSVTNAEERAKLSDSVDISVGDGKVISGDVNKGYDTTDSDGWNTLSFTTGSLPALGESAYTQIITLSAGNGTFVREVEFFLTNPYLLKLNMPSKVPAVLGSAVAASLEIQPRLPMGIFPLEFVVVAENNSLSPDATLNTLPVVTGVKVDGTPGGNYFGYKVTLDYDDYCTVSGETTTYNTIIPLYFKTNMANSATAVGSADGTDCYAYNQYHNIATDEFFNGNLYPLSLSLVESSVQYGIGKDVKATLTIGTSTIDNGDWSTDENGRKYLDFVISDTNKSLTFDSVIGLATTVAEKKVNALRVYQSGFASNKNFTLLFKTEKFRSATTITASNDNFTQASATLTNTGFGKLGISVTEGDTLLPGAGQTVAVAVTVPAGAEAAFDENGQLELTLTTSAAYLAEPATRASISGSGTNFTVVVSNGEYNNTTGSTYNFAFTTTDGNTVGTRTITVSHPYLDSASAQTITKKKGLTMKFVASETSTTAVTELSDGADYYLFVELEETTDVELPISLVVSDLNNTTLVYNDTENISNGTYSVSVAKGSKTCSVKLKATINTKTSSGWGGDNYEDARYTITASVNDNYETVTLTMTGDRDNTGSWMNPTYVYFYNVN